MRSLERAGAQIIDGGMKVDTEGTNISFLLGDELPEAGIPHMVKFIKDYARASGWSVFKASCRKKSVEFLMTQDSYQESRRTS